VEPHWWRPTTKHPTGPSLLSKDSARQGAHCALHSLGPDSPFLRVPTLALCGKPDKTGFSLDCVDLAFLQPFPWQYEVPRTSRQVLGGVRTAAAARARRAGRPTDSRPFFHGILVARSVLPASKRLGGGFITPPQGSGAPCCGDRGWAGGGCAQPARCAALLGRHRAARRGASSKKRHGLQSGNWLRLGLEWAPSVADRGECSKEKSGLPPPARRGHRWHGAARRARGPKASQSHRGHIQGVGVPGSRVAGAGSR
jgi:hypothetical protein